MARKSIIIPRVSGKQNIPLDVSGTVKQLFINSYLKQGTDSFKSVPLQNTQVSIMIESTEIVTDYAGTGIDEFNMLEEKFKISPAVQLQVTAKRAIASENVDPLICLTLIYDKDK